MEGRWLVGWVYMVQYERRREDDAATHNEILTIV